MVRVKEKLAAEIDSLFDDVTVEIAYIRDLCRQGSPMEEIIDQLDKLEELLA